MKTVSIFVAIAVLSGFHLQLVASTTDRARPPLARDGKGPAKSATLIKKANLKEESARPSDPLKGPDWVETSATKVDQGTSDTIVLSSPNDRFHLRLTESTNNEGDVAAYLVTLTWKGDDKSRVSLGISTGTVISPDSRYIMLEPLQLIDVDAWKLYDLRKALKLKEGYFMVDRWTKDGKKILVHSVQCPYDCPAGESIEYWLIELR
jgi:hypothetical protein